MNVFELFATLGLDTTDYDNGLNHSENKGKSFGSGLLSAAGTAAKAIGAAAMAAGYAVVSVGTQAVKAYAEYQQLVGGVKKIFDTEASSSASWVVENAKRAWKTCGMSANEYMQTVTSFAASLLASLDGNTRQAAASADRAVQDMSDNANTFGTDISSLQAAYAGFAKGNFTMLDNLKLGYGGTKTEMERLLKDAESLTGIHYNIDNFDDIINAIHVIQNNMGITGTTSKEAGTTIEGSMNAAKAAWSNLLTAIADDDGDVGKAVDDLVESLFGDEDGEGGFVNNVIDRIPAVFDGIGTMIDQLSPKIADQLPQIINDLLPKILNGAVDIMQGILPRLPELLKTTLQSISIFAPELVAMIADVLPDLVDAAIQMVPTLIDVLVSVVQTIALKAPKMAKDIGQSILDVVPDLLRSILDLVTNTLINPIIHEMNKVLSYFGIKLDYVKTESNEGLIEQWEQEIADLKQQTSENQQQTVVFQQEQAEEAAAEQNAVNGRYGFLNYDQISWLYFVADQWSQGNGDYYNAAEWTNLGISPEVQNRFLQDLGATYHDMDRDSFLELVEEWFSGDYSNAVGDALSGTMPPENQETTVTLNIDTYNAYDGSDPQALAQVLLDAFVQAQEQQASGTGKGGG